MAPELLSQACRLRFWRMDRQTPGNSGWLGSPVVRLSDLQLNGREFDPRSPHYRYWNEWPPSGVVTTAVRNQLPRPTQPPTLRGTGNKYWPRCGDALRLGSKAGQDGSFHSWINVWVTGTTAWSLVNTCHSESLRGILTKRRYTNVPSSTCSSSSTGWSDLRWRGRGFDSSSGRD